MIRPSLLLRLHRITKIHTRPFSLFNPTASPFPHQNRIYDPIRTPTDLHTLTLLSASSNRPLITLWTAPWCATCAMVKPLLLNLLEVDRVGEAEGGLCFAEVAMDSPLLEDLPLTYRISSMPTLLAFARQEARFETKVVRGEELRDREFLMAWLVGEARSGGRKGGLFGG